MYAEVERAMAEKTEVLIAKQDELNQQIDAVGREVRMAHLNDDFPKMSEKLEELRALREEKFANDEAMKTIQRDAVRELLNEVNPTGTTITNFSTDSDQVCKDVIATVSPLLPSSWANLNNNERLTVIQVDRGYSRGVNEIGLSGGGDRRESTALHELAHRTSALNPKISELERDFYSVRTAGETAEKLSKVTGNTAYEAHEVTNCLSSCWC